jgi:signal transduction histidine kinase
MVISQGQSLLLASYTPSRGENLQISEKQRALIEAIDLRTAIGVPLAAGGHTFGSMVLFGSRRQYGEADLALAEAISVHVAAALENARLYAAAREAIRARDDFLVLASHELRTPLASLQLQADVLRREAQRAGNDAWATRSDAMAKQVGRLGALVDHMDEALHVRAGGLTLGREPCDLLPIVEGTAKSVAQQAPSDSTITVNVEGSAPWGGRWDRRRIEQLVGILLENAVKFGAGKPVDVTLRKDGNEVVLAVRDHGLGITPERLSSIFSPFERAVPKENYGGLGLGLYIAKAITEAHGGTISVSSTVGAGTTFEVRLPL